VTCQQRLQFQINQEFFLIKI